MKQVPRPASLRTAMLPPIISHSRRLMASPRPVPPSRRVVAESACTNGWNSLGVSHLVQQRPQREALDIQLGLASLDLGQVEHVVDEPRQTRLAQHVGDRHPHDDITLLCVVRADA